MDSLEIIPSAWDLTADELIFMNTTRIDIQGNRLPVSLPLANWTFVSDGAVNVTFNHPVQWIPTGLGGRGINFSINYSQCHQGCNDWYGTNC
jgi:hypothetical protein